MRFGIMRIAIKSSLVTELRSCEVFALEKNVAEVVVGRGKARRQLQRVAI